MLRSLVGSEMCIRDRVYPDVTVDFQPIPADFQTKMKAMMAGGAAPDVFLSLIHI